MASPPGPLDRKVSTCHPQSGQADIPAGFHVEASSAQGRVPATATTSQSSLYRQLPFRRTPEGSPYLPPSTCSPFMHGGSPEKSPDKYHRCLALPGAFSSPVATPATRPKAAHGSTLTSQDQHPGWFSSASAACPPSFNQSPPLDGVHQGTPPACSISVVPPAYPEASRARSTNTTSANSTTTSFPGSLLPPSLRTERAAHFLQNHSSPTPSSSSPRGYCCTGSANGASSYAGSHHASVVTSNDQVFFSSSTGIASTSPSQHCLITALSPPNTRALQGTALRTSDSPFPVLSSQHPCSPFVSPENSSFPSPTRRLLSDPLQQQTRSRASNCGTPAEVSSVRPPQINSGTGGAAPTGALQLSAAQDTTANRGSFASGSSCELRSADGFFFSSPVLTPSAADTAFARPRGCIGASPNTPRRLMHSPATPLPSRTTRLSPPTEEPPQSSAHLPLLGGAGREEEDERGVLASPGHPAQAVSCGSRYRAGPHTVEHQHLQTQQVHHLHRAPARQVPVEDHQHSSARSSRLGLATGSGPILIANHCVPLQQTFSSSREAPSFEFSSRARGGVGQQQHHVTCFSVSGGCPGGEQEEDLLLPEERERLRRLQQLVQETQKKQQRAQDLKVQNSLTLQNTYVTDGGHSTLSKPTKQEPGHLGKQRALLQRDEADTGYLYDQEHSRRQAEQLSHGLLRQAQQGTQQGLLGTQEEDSLASHSGEPPRPGPPRSYLHLQERQSTQVGGAAEGLQRGPVVEQQIQGQQARQAQNISCGDLLHQERQRSQELRGSSRASARQQEVRTDAADCTYIPGTQEGRHGEAALVAPLSSDPSTLLNTQHPISFSLTSVSSAPAESSDFLSERKHRTARDTIDSKHRAVGPGEGSPVSTRGCSAYEWSLCTQSEAEVFQGKIGILQQGPQAQPQQLAGKPQQQQQRHAGDADEKEHQHFRREIFPVLDEDRLKREKHQDWTQRQGRSFLCKGAAVHVEQGKDDQTHHRYETGGDSGGDQASRRKHEELSTEHLRKRQQVEAPHENGRLSEPQRQTQLLFQLKSSPAAWHRAAAVDCDLYEGKSCREKDENCFLAETDEHPQVVTSHATRRTHIRDVQTGEQLSLAPRQQQPLREEGGGGGRGDEERESLEAAELLLGRGTQKTPQTRDASAASGVGATTFSSGSSFCSRVRETASNLSSTHPLRKQTEESAWFSGGRSFRDRRAEATQNSTGGENKTRLAVDCRATPAMNSLDSTGTDEVNALGGGADAFAGRRGKEEESWHAHTDLRLLYRQSGRTTSSLNASLDSGSSSSSSRSRNLSADLGSSSSRSCITGGAVHSEGGSNKRSATVRTRDGGVASRHQSQAPAEPLRRAGTPVENMGLSVTDRSRRGLSRQQGAEDARVAQDKAGRSLKCLSLFSGGGQKRTHQPHPHLPPPDESHYVEGVSGAAVGASTRPFAGKERTFSEGRSPSSRSTVERTGSGYRERMLFSPANVGSGKDGGERAASSRQLLGNHSEGLWTEGKKSQGASPSAADGHRSYSVVSKEENCVMEEAPSSGSDCSKGGGSGGQASGRSDAAMGIACDVDMKVTALYVTSHETEEEASGEGRSPEGPSLSRSMLADGGSQDDRPIGGGGAALKFFQTLQEEDNALQPQRRHVQTPGSRAARPSPASLSVSQKSVFSADRARSIPRTRPTEALRGGEAAGGGGQLWGAGGGSAAADSVVAQQPRKLFAAQASTAGRGARYLMQEQLEPFDEPPPPRFIQDVLLPRLEKEATKGDWVEQVETLDTLRRLAKYHMVLLTSEVLRRAVAGVLGWLGSPRSAVAKNACLALADLFLFGQQRLDLSVHEVVEVCMKKCSQSNEFLNDAVKAVLAAVCQYASEGRVGSALLHSIPSCKQQGARSVGAACMALLFQRSGTNATRLRELPQMVSLLVTMAAEASPDVRAAARVALAILGQSVDYNLLRRCGVSSEALHKMEGFVSRTTAREIEDVMRSAALGFGASAGASLSSSLSSLAADDRRTGTRIRGGG